MEDGRREQLRRELKEWERQFKQRKGRKPASSDVPEDVRKLYGEYKKAKHAEESRQQAEREEHEALRAERRRRFCEYIKTSLTRKQALRVQSKLNNYPEQLRLTASEALDERLTHADGHEDSDHKRKRSTNNPDDSDSDDSSSDDEKQHKYSANHTVQHNDTSGGAAQPERGDSQAGETPVQAQMMSSVEARRKAVLEDSDSE